MKKRENALFASLAILLTLGQSACTATVDGVQDDTQPTAEAFNNLVPGPGLNGTWYSGCTPDPRSFGASELLTFAISGQNITRTAAQFSDGACATPSGSQKEVGLFRYDSTLAGGIYEVEYRFDIPNLPGGTYTQYENYRLDGATLWVSNEIGGDAAAADVALTQGGVPQPTPTPSTSVTPLPTPVPSTVADNHVATVGDVVVYAAVAQGESQTETYKNQGFNSQTGQWAVLTNIVGPQPDTETDNYASLWSSSQAQSDLTACGSQGGTIQTVTVPAGTFLTCMIDSNGRTIWYGDVPIWGFVKVQWDDGSYQSELQCYAWGDTPGSTCN
jgi:hypothetical protein